MSIRRSRRSSTARSPWRSPSAAMWPVYGRPCGVPGRGRPKRIGRIWKSSTTGTPSPTSRSLRGRFFDGATIHLLTTVTLHLLRDVYSQGQFEVQRLHSNMVVDPARDEQSFVEDT